ncbi:biotin-dependent carboxyltransferase family protein [Pseudonocardia sp. C8]|uniref:5-oxoprolinase subunit C family protein n=1 Tax=Pseudonocardia sp. C8 TaxID=2762759 RepID=UPI001642799E|nr:biotin-dependent carboxyltransferase family protein [Pseudonocardia sp. C8]MBC3191083.1 biotin-dependent carboxyltransferase family protein [Pseudonocardia sp. C8]
MIEIVRTGPQATVQDAGRVGHGHLGVPRAGAMDLRALEQANRLVGNPPGTAAIEILLGGVAIRFHADVSFALTGAPLVATLHGRPVHRNAWTYARRGEELVVCGRPLFGLYSYLAVAGGIAVEPVLSSRSTDSLSGLGPPALAAGDVLPIGSERGVPSEPGDVLLETASPDTVLDVRFQWGPRSDWFTGAARARLASTRWTISNEVNRIAARLTGPALEYARTDQLPTEGVHPGSVQVPPSGLPLLFLANHPPTGGYPVIAVVCERDLPRIAQAPPGTILSMRPVRCRHTTTVSG